MHKYIFPPFSTGETGRVGSPKRREIGHGALARRALLPVLPTREEFPYAIRQVSEAMGSNGSTSMGSVCASTLSLLQAGVPLQAPVAGIAMGLISGEVDGKTEYVALTDILGAEDAFGDMDFKVAGTASSSPRCSSTPSSTASRPRSWRPRADPGQGRPPDDPRRDGRGHRRSRGDVAPRPRIITVKVPVDKIGEVIGPKGKVINQIQDDTGAQMSIEDDGTIYIGATNGEAAEAARAAVNAIANPTMPEVGERYLGTVVKTTNFGAFVSLLPGQGRPAAHQQAARPRRRQARRGRRGRRLGGPEDPGPDRRDRRPRQALAGPGRRGGRGSDADAEAVDAEDRRTRVHRAAHRRPAGVAGRLSPQKAGTTRTSARPTGRRRPGDLARTPDRPARRPAGRHRADGRRRSAGASASGSASARATRRPTLHGCSHFLEHLLFKGTPARSALDISVALDAVGGEFNAFTAKEYTCFHARVLDDDLPLAVDVLGDMITGSLITRRGRRGRA